MWELRFVGLRFGAMDVRKPEDAAAVEAASEAPSSWLGIDPVLTPIAAFFEQYGWWIVVAVVIYVTVAPSVQRQLHEWRMSRSRAEATAPDRVAVLDEDRRRVREAQAAKFAAMSEEKRQELKERAAAKAKEEKKLCAIIPREFPALRMLAPQTCGQRHSATSAAGGGGGKRPVRWGADRRAALRKRGG